MIITGITTRIIRQSSELWYGALPVPDNYTPYFDFPFSIIHTSEGIEGYTMDYCPLGQGYGSAYAVHDIYYRILKGKNPVRHEAIWQECRSLQRHLYNYREAVWGNLDVAIWDIKGKITGLPIADLLGRCRDKVPVYASCPPQTIVNMDMLEQQVLQKIKEGFKGVKLQLFGRSGEELPKIRKARELAGEAFPLMLDCNGALSFEDALKVGFELDDLRYEWFEEPIPDAQIVLLKKLSGAIRTPVLAAETVGLFELPHYMNEGAIDIIRGDVHHKSGITGVMKALGMCEMMGYEFEIHTAASPLLDVANLHVACATRLSRFLESHHSMFRFGLKNSPLEIDKDGCQHCPGEPGLGVELDWDWLDNHTVKVLKDGLPGEVRMD
ncbi:mandelate racemase/muconate lactonizing enzyme family protein [Agriterribacter sp.]|uniref:mandelate racemase/muconate lactonizing enzyme family protein n=1 Tax=Agriterribacter sp. TaxID=2821509 RepID=UPI002C813332|nr:mandelate racemase/muconate lactonizing enzyme family protein [Agriterribacter sp.]HRP54915.1 mandelate racemase/muconate lactonizing enzyme family protein [Agriterribacter sp.]